MCNIPWAFCCSTALSVVLGAPLDYPATQVEGREGCYPEDTAQYRMEVAEEIRQILQEGLGLIGSRSGSGSGSGD